MRIAIVTYSARVAGGIASYLDTIIPLLEEAGNEIALLCEYDAPTAVRPINRNANAPLWVMADLGAVRARDSLRRWHPDVIYSHGLSEIEFEAWMPTIAPAIAFAHDYRATCISGAKAFAFPAATPCARPLGGGCVANFYPRRCGGLNPLTMFADFHRAASRLELLRNFRVVLTASEFVRAEYIRNGLAPQSVRCIGLPVADQGISQSVSSVAPTVNLKEVPLRLLFAGRMESLKGGQLLLEALPLISAALPRPLLLTFAGDGRARLEWKRRADALMRRHPILRVEFVGWVDSAALTLLFDLSDLLVVPSLWPEPFGLVGPEAGLRGLPATAFAVGGIPEWLTDGVNGTLADCSPPTPTSLANAIVRCLRDSTDHARMRRGAFKLAQRFSPEHHLKALVNVIQGLCVHSLAESGSALSTPAAHAL